MHITSLLMHVARGQVGYKSASSDGMIPRTITNLFHRVDADQSHSYKIGFSYVQVYQEEVHDLLSTDANGSHPLPLRESMSKGLYLEGLSEHVVHNTDEVLALLAQGRRKLVVAETKMNRHSSRSHALCFIHVEKLLEKKNNNRRSGGKNSMADVLADRDLLVKGKITLCDLAGSERIKRSESEGQRLAEAQRINSSLLELGNVVSALATPGHTHVPFRNSVLTRLLQESLGGNCKTSLIVCCSPLMRDQSETKGALLFGQRAMCVVQNARINVELDYRHLANELARELERKQAAWTKLERKLRKQLVCLV